MSGILKLTLCLYLFLAVSLDVARGGDSDTPDNVCAFDSDCAPDMMCVKSPTGFICLPRWLESSSTTTTEIPTPAYCTDDSDCKAGEQCSNVFRFGMMCNPKPSG